MTNPIVVVNVSQQIAPTPSKLQKTGAFISQGATTLAAGKFALLTQLSDLTPLLVSPINLFSIAWSGGVATATITGTLPYTIGQVVNLTIAGTVGGIVPNGYNGTFPCTITGSNSFTYALAVNPGTASPPPGTVISASVAEVTAMATTFFSQGNGQGVYILELGAVDVAHAVTALTNYIAAENPQFFYSYLVPRNWDVNGTFLSLIAQYESTTSKRYFYTTTTKDTYTTYTALMKDVKTYIEAPGIPALEFSAASDFFVNLNLSPSNTNKVTPNAFAFVFGVTPYPTQGNGPLLTALKNAGVNIIGTGAEGGISDTIILWGTTMDGRDFTYWYAVDWVQINLDLSVSNAVINGSNNPLNPLYYNQDGINRLEAAIARILGDGVTFGLVLFPVIQTELDGPAFGAALSADQFTGDTVVNAVPFIPYSIANPGDFKIGRYAGFSVVFTPNRGFIQIVIDVLVTDFIAQ